MTVKELKKVFINSLSEYYHSEEIHSFFTILSEKYLSLSRIQVVLDSETTISDEKFNIFKEAIKRLKQSEPIQYIIGEAEFFGLPFKVDSNVLIPRPETEELVSWILEDVEAQIFKLNQKRKENKEKPTNCIEKLPFSILDIGTGSGCISISLAYNLPTTYITGVDISDGTLKIAIQNAILNKVNVNFIQADILNYETKSWNLEFDIIVSNPPYVREREKDQMKPNVIAHEPGIALFVNGEDPLLFYRKIAQLSKKYLKPDGTLYFEINQYLYKDLVSILKSEGFNTILLRKDIFGKDRILKCKRDE